MLVLFSPIIMEKSILFHVCQMNLIIHIEVQSWEKERPPPYLSEPK